MFSNGSSYGEILSALNPRYKTKSGREFGKNSIHDILCNKKYIGVYTFNRSASKKDGRRNHHRSKPPEDIIVIPGAIPPIIDEETFTRVQERIAGNRIAPARSKAKVNYLLSGLIWCGECDHRMTGDSSSYLTKKYKEFKKNYYYTCNHANRTKECKNEKIHKDMVESYVLAELEKKIFNTETIPILAQKIVEYHRHQQVNYAGEQHYLEKELAAVKKQIDNLVEALAKGGGIAVQSIIEKITNLESKKVSLESQLIECQIKAEANMITVESITNYLLANMRLLKNKNLDTCKRLIQEFVEKVLVRKENIEVIMKITVDLHGGCKGTRTPDLLNANQALSQLSYTPKFFWH